jgi:hypothetical protein
VNPLKRSLAVLTALAGLSLASSPASAEAYFGVRLETIVIVPVFGIQLGYDFESAGPDEGRFGMRVGAQTFLGSINRVSAEALYRFKGQGESTAYAGAGAGIVFAGNLFGSGSSSVVPEIHGLIGYEWAISPETALYLEGGFGVAIVPQYGSSSVNFNPIGSFSIGLNLKF